MSDTTFYPRWAKTSLQEALKDSPVTLVHGPRQCGKTTLVRAVADADDYHYISFDDDIQLNAATNDPAGFLEMLPGKVALDEVQRVPQLFTAIKARVDRNRIPGQFILTGSANVLLLPKLADSLAGRMEIIRLHPLAQCELATHPPNFLDLLFSGKFIAKKQQRLGKDLAARIVDGGYPAALARSSAPRRIRWYRDYVETLIQRDIKDLARISDLHSIPRLLQLVAGQTARLLNIADMSSPFQLSRPTIRSYMTLLECIFLVETLSPWHSNRISRLIKTPKLHICDTGLASALLGYDAEALYHDRTLMGQLLESFVYQDLRRQASWYDRDISFFHFRDKDGAEVDVVLQCGARHLAGVEVKAAATVRASDFKGLRKLKNAAGKRFTVGVVLYDGEDTVSFGDGMLAVPIRSLWEV
ncbi:MAG: ATP-binding protein [Candidatus Hydrogenedentes bacterium]|nr:ATP-binding protein [Candidatus Hydrogenedentota bacterium]